MNLLKHKWTEAPQLPLPTEATKTVAAPLGLSEIIKASRMAETAAQAETTPVDLGEEWHSPFLFNDMEKAVHTVADVIARHGIVIIHGDYDADGLTATAVLYRYLSQFGLEIYTYIPDRLEEGYGLAAGGVKSALEHKVDLVITVDCGIVSHDEIAELSAAGILTVVTDHHNCRPTLPAADACLNPKWPGESYPFPYLAGAGVALKLVQGMSEFFHQPEDVWRDLTDFAMIGTVADVMPLVGENVAIVKEGLSRLNNRARAAWQILLNLPTDETITATTIGFRLAPLINAAGRMGCVSPALQIMLTDEADIAGEMAQKLQSLNEKRRELTQAVWTEVERQICENPLFLAAPILFVAGENWHTGILGILAAKAAAEFNRPTFVLNREVDADGKVLYRGSGRTYGTIDLVATLNTLAPLLEAYGGHRQAAGVTVTAAALAEIQALLAGKQQAAFTCTELAGLPELCERTPLPCDLEVDLSVCNVTNWQELQNLQPFGESNPEPVLAWQGCTVLQLRKIGKQKQHLQLLLQDKAGRRIKGIFFGGGYWADAITAPVKLDLLGVLQINTWQGLTEAQLRVVDIHLCLESLEKANLAVASEICASSEPAVSDETGYLPRRISENPQAQKQFLAEVYRFLQRVLDQTWQLVDPAWLADVWSWHFKFKFAGELVEKILTLFAESGILECKSWSAKNEHLYLIGLRQPHNKVKLSDLDAYHKLMHRW